MKASGYCSIRGSSRPACRWIPIAHLRAMTQRSRMSLVHCSRSTNIYWEQGILDVLFEYSIQSDRSLFSIHAAFDRFSQHTVTALRFMPPGGTIRALELRGDEGLVRLLTRDGARPQRVSSTLASITFSTARIICCSCSAS